jgi:predicted metalloendopeptidase
MRAGPLAGHRTAVSITVVLIALTCACATGNRPAPPSSGLGLSDFDRSVRPQDDLYQFTNGGWLRRTPIPPDLSGTDSLTQLRLVAQEQQRAILEQAEHHPEDVQRRKLGDLYASFMDTNRINQLGASPLQPDFAEIDALKTPADLVKFLGRTQRDNRNILIALSINRNPMDSRTYLASVRGPGQTLLAEYYSRSDARSVAVRAQFLEYVAKMYTLAGLADPPGAARDVLALESRLVATMSSRVQLEDVVATHTSYPISAANQLTPGLDWTSYLSEAGINANELIIADRKYLTGLARLLTTVPMDTWKQYLRWRMISDNARYLSDEFVSTQFEFGKVLGGQLVNSERWRRGVAVVNEAMAFALGERYVAIHTTEETKRRVTELAQELITTFHRSIQRLDWMSPPTKAAAQAKLAKLAIKIGYPDMWRDYSALVIKKDDLFGNMRRAGQFHAARQVARLSHPADRAEWVMTPQTVNAHYEPGTNDVTIPAAILQPPFYDPAADNATNYGAIGALIGHEISHAFDDQGRLYDGDGNLHDWWSKADAAAFNAKTTVLVARYRSFSLAPGKRVNGKLTLSENIADLSGVTMAYRAYRDSLGTTVAPVLDGFTGDQRFFLGYGQIWRATDRPETMLKRLAEVHSPEKFRINGVVPNVDAFYTAFDVLQGDKLYLPPDQRIHIW